MPSNHLSPLPTDTGLVAGVLSAGGQIEAYLGIPYAAPPVGQLRWRPPVAPAAWAGVRHCDRYADACVQPAMPTDGIMRQFSFAEPPECGISEDCLYLNVWRPAQAVAGLPVIVFVYGGGHRVGSGSHPVSRGEALACRGAIVVTMNYRVGALGYLAHPELTREQGASGNYACADVIESLQWVQRNIAAFGGDSQRVTLFGQSAGASLVTVLMASPLAKGLFQRAIVHSGGRFNGSPPGPPAIRTLAQAEQMGLKMAGEAGALTLKQLRSLPADALEAPRGFWGPIVDGRVLQEAPDRVFERGEEAPVPLLVGFNKDEGAPYPVPGVNDLASFETYLTSTYGDDAGRVRALYPCTTDREAVEASYALKRDTHFGFQSWACAHLHARRGLPTYLFAFERTLPLPEGMRFHEQGPPSGYGAFHGAELWYAFDNLGLAPWPWQAADRQIAERMSAAWIEFARSGRPGHAQWPAWPALDDQGLALVIGDEVRVAPPRNLAALRFFSARHFT